MSVRLDPSAPELLVPQQARLLHVGPPKTGTTSLQRSAADARESLLRQGVLYPGTRYSHRKAMTPFTQRHSGWAFGTAADDAGWAALAAEVHGAGDRRVFLSSEDLAELPADRLPDVLAAVGGEVHVAMTLRSLPALLSSAWSQYLKSGLRADFDTWVTGVLADPPQEGLTPSFARRSDLTGLVTTWLELVGRDRLTVVVLDPADRDLVPHAFESLLGLEPGTLTGGRLSGGQASGDLSNRSFTLAEAELVRRLNEQVRVKGRLAWSDYERYLRNSTIPAMLRRAPGREETRIVPPRWAVERAAATAQEHARRIAELDARVVDDLAGLPLPVPARDEPAPVPSELPVDAAAEALLACLRAGVRWAQKPPPTPSPAPDLDRVEAEVLAGVLADRVGRRVRRSTAGLRPRRAR